MRYDVPSEPVPSRDLLAELATWLRRGSPVQALLLVIGVPAVRLPDLAELCGATIEHVSPDGFEQGVAAVDAAVDAGSDLLLVAAPGVCEAVAAAAVAHWTGTEPVRTIGFDHDMADHDWSALVVDVRDRLAALPADRTAALAGLDPALATSVGIVVQAVRRQTPIVLDGLGALTAALIAVGLEPSTADWCLLAATALTSAARVAAGTLGSSAILDLGLPGGDGIGAAVALQVLRAAVVAHTPAPRN